LAEIFKRL